MLKQHHFNWEQDGQCAVAMAMADIDSVSPDAREGISEILSAGELARAERFVRDVDRNRFLASHYLLRTFLSQYAGESPEEFSFGANRFKKPHLENSDLQFNLSHSGSYATVAITRGKQVGIDIETGVNQQTVEDIAPRILTRMEMQQLEEAGIEGQVALFTRFWIAKESILKAFGEGLYQNPREIELFMESQPRVSRLPVAMGPAKAWKVRFFDSPPGFPEVACTVEN